jgi:hypothetical protein
MTRATRPWRLPFPEVMQRVNAPIGQAQRDELAALFERWRGANGTEQRERACDELLDAAGRQVGA